MKMKKYTAETMVEVMKKVRADFGDDAIILSSTVVNTKGFLGFFKKKSVEVVAGFDEPAPKMEEPVLPFLEPHFESADKASMELKQEMNEMKKMLKDMQQVARQSRFPDELKPLLAHLDKQGLSTSSVTQIGEEIYNRMKAEKKDFTQEEQLFITQQLLEREMEDLPFGGISFNKRYINVLGPTGVGKTTTIAKIAARALLENKKKSVLSRRIHIELRQLSSFGHMLIFCKRLWKLLITVEILKKQSINLLIGISFSSIQQDGTTKK